jgi:NADPH-dependent glutamate synthase beta subunit-like oxidoreductase
MRCKRDELDEPVAQGEIHRYIADTMYKMGRERAVYNRLIKEKLPGSGKKVSIVGAGPAGLAAAFWLVRLGHEVTIYEARPEAGGVPLWGIPAYRLPKDVLRKELGFIRRLGVRFVFNTLVGADLSWERIAEMSDAVLVCLGAQADIGLGIAGEGLPGVISGSAFLEELSLGRRPSLGTEVVVVGGGNTAVDAARSALRLGSRVSLVYRRSKADMPANAEEIEGALEEGVTLVTMARPVEILADEASGGLRAFAAERMTAGAIDETGRPSPIASGERFEIHCDSVIVAVGERVDAGGIERLGVATDKGGRVGADQFSLRTANPKVYAAGDALSGPATAAEAMGLAKRAAAAIDAALSGQDRFGTLFRRFDYAMRVPLETSRARSGKAPRLSPRDRMGGFVEISKGYTGEEARIEAERCLRCDVRERARRSPSGPGEEKS